MRFFYPKTTPKIIHKGKTGNIYRLDGFDKWVRLHEALKKSRDFTIDEVSARGKENLAKSLIRLTHPERIIKAYQTGLPKTLAASSGVMWQTKLYDYVLESALTCKKAVDSAVADGVSLAGVGGGHHAEKNRPLGFCTINTMAISALYAQQKYHLKTAIIDLDVHYSNGCIDILKRKVNVLVTSLWNKKISKWTYHPPGKNIWHRRIENVRQYFSELQKLQEAVDKFNPGIILYHLGLDVLDTDRMGGVRGFNNNLVIKRELAMINLFQKLHTPVVIFMGGAYVDYSNGLRLAIKQKDNQTALQLKALNLYQNLLVRP